MKHPELLIPASSLEVLKTAVVFGADAVYIGGEAFGLRAKAKNFSMEEIREGIAFAHAHDVKVYITANILAHNGDLSGVRAYFEELKEIKPDALIISDPGVFMIAREVCPEIDIHISTQANNTNYGTYQFWHQLGARRVVTARELSMAELKEIREKAPADLEMETLSMVLCVFPIPDAVCCPIILPAVMQIVGPALTHADGNMPSWKRPDRENICRFTRMNVAPIFLIPRTCA